jgi:hypothetical protein
MRFVVEAVRKEEYAVDDEYAKESADVVAEIPADGCVHASYDARYVPKSETCDFVIERTGSVVIVFCVVVEKYADAESGVKPKRDDVAVILSVPLEFDV